MNQFLIDQLADLILSLSKSLGVPDEKILEGIRLAHSNTNLLAVERLHNTVAVVAKGAKHKSVERVRLMETLVCYFDGLSVLMLKALDDGDCVTAIKRFGDINKIVGWLQAYWFGENATKEKSIADGAKNGLADEELKLIVDVYKRALSVTQGNKLEARRLTGKDRSVTKRRNGKALSARAVFDALKNAERRGIAT